MFNLSNPKEIDYFLRDFTNLYKSSYESLLTKLYIQEDLRGESNYQYDILYYNYLFNTMYLLYLDYNRNPELGWSYFVNKYSIEYIKKLYRCRGINIDKVFEIFHLPTDYTVELEITSGELENNFVIEELIVTVVIPTTSKIEFSQLNEYCINSLQTCRCSNCYRFVEISIPRNNYLVCSHITCDKIKYGFGDSAIIKFYLTNTSTENIIIGVENLLVNDVIYTDVTYTLQPGETQIFTYKIGDITSDVLVTLTNQLCQVLLDYSGGISDFTINYNEITCFSNKTRVIVTPIGDNLSNISWSINGTELSVLSFYLVAGTYTITAIQGLVIITHTFTITKSAEIIPITIVTSIACNGGTGAINLTATGGTAPYSFWLTGKEIRPVIQGLTADFTLLFAGGYTAHIKDSNGCEVSGNILLTEPSTMSFSTVIVNSLSVGGIDQNNGSITFNVLGGTAPYQYSIDGGVNYQSSNIFIGLKSQVYHGGFILDANDCTFPISFTIPLTVATEEITLNNVYTTNEYNTAGTSIGQVFINVNADYITGIDIELFNGGGVSGTQTMELKLYNNSSFLPIDLIGTTTSLCTNISTILNFEFSTPIQVINGYTYCFDIINKLNANGVGYPNEIVRTNRVAVVGGYGYGNGILAIEVYQYSFQIKGIIL